MWQPGHSSLTSIHLPPRFYHRFHVQRFALENQRPLDLHAHFNNVTCPNNLQMLISKALVKQTRRKWTKVKASLRNLNLFTNFGSVAKRIASRLLNSHKSLRAVTTLGIYAMNCIVANLCTILISISIKSPRQSSQVHASSLKQLAKQVRLARAYRV